MGSLKTVKVKQETSYFHGWLIDILIVKEATETVNWEGNRLEGTRGEGGLLHHRFNWELERAGA